MSEIPAYACPTCKGCKIVRSIVPSRASGYLDGICATCNGTGMKKLKTTEKPPLYLTEELKNHIAEVNWFFKDYGVQIQLVVDDESDEIEVMDGIASMSIAKPHKWTQVTPPQQVFLDTNIIQSQEYCECIRTLQYDPNAPKKCNQCGKKIYYREGDKE
jgi:ssDNA-binding Zn-finger/Zn-ribbon topoisomerase 1